MSWGSRVRVGCLKSPGFGARQRQAWATRQQAVLEAKMVPTQTGHDILMLIKLAHRNGRFVTRRSDAVASMALVSLAPFRPSTRVQTGTLPSLAFVPSASNAGGSYLPATPYLPRRPRRAEVRCRCASTPTFIGMRRERRCCAVHFCWRMWPGQTGELWFRRQHHPRGDDTRHSWWLCRSSGVVCIRGACSILPDASAAMCSPGRPCAETALAGNGKRSAANTW